MVSVSVLLNDSVGIVNNYSINISDKNKRIKKSIGNSYSNNNKILKSGSVFCVVLGLDAEAMARLADLLNSTSSEATDQEGTTGSPNPELSSGFTYQEVGQSDIMPARPSETPSLQTGAVLIHELKRVVRRRLRTLLAWKRPVEASAPWEEM